MHGRCGGNTRRRARELGVFKCETDLGARPKELFEHGLQLFDKEVHKGRNKFKAVLRADKIAVDETTSTMDSLLTAFNAEGVGNTLSELL